MSDVPIDISEGHVEQPVERASVAGMRPPSDTKGKTPLVAVLGVHGVGAHAAGETENAMADLLMALPAGDAHAARYFETFKMVGLQIPLQPVGDVEPDPPPKKTIVGKILDLYEERSVTFSKKATKVVEARAVAGEPKLRRGEVGNEYTSLILRDYEGGAKGDVYVTTRLEGGRDAGAPGGAAKVHIYEVLWADLASPDSTFLSFFVALFQLLLHLGSLSRIAVDTGSVENKGAVWSFYLAMQRYAVRMLQIALPLFKVILLIAVLAYVPAALKDKLPSSFPPLLAALGATVLAFLVLGKRRKPLAVNPWLWSLLALVPAVIGAAVGEALFLRPGLEIASSLLSWVLLGGPLLFYILSNYQEVRKGVAISGGIAYVLCLAIFGYFIFHLGVDVAQATFWMVELLVAAIRVSWIFLIAFAFLALVSGSLVWRLQRDDGKRARARAAVRTSRFALALPSALFLVVTSLISGAIYYATRKIAPTAFSSVLDHQLWGLDCLVRYHLIPNPSCLDFPGNYFESLLVWEVGYQFPLTLGLFFLAMFLLIWWALPGVMTETFPLRQEQKPPRSSTNAESVALGSWLSRGLDATSVVTFLFWSSIFLAPPLFYLISHFSEQFRNLLVQTTQWIIDNPALAISGPVLAAVVKYGSPVLATVLDVDTYLRTTPQEEPPRAKIIERYVSTLRYLASYRDADGRGYDSVVIVAHSLGALISGDLLRYLHWQKKLGAMGFATESQGGIPITLFTMGNPTRQLLNRFFPYLYDWVRDEPDNGLRPLPGLAAAPPTIDPAAESLPDPKDLGVARWVNAYRSGDYVGRSLWVDEWYDRTSVGVGRYPQQIYKASDGVRTEMCIGAGAHTHYWDDTAPDVAEELNLLI